MRLFCTTFYLELFVDSHYFPYSTGILRLQLGELIWISPRSSVLENPTALGYHAALIAWSCV